MKKQLCAPISLFSPRRLFRVSFVLLALVLTLPGSLCAQTWNLGTGGSWNTAGNWNPSGVPNAIGTTVIFNNAASGSNPAQTANSSVALDGTKTVGQIDFNNNAVNTFTYTIATGSGGPLVFDGIGVGPAVINVNGIVGATGNNTISVAMRFDDSVVANVNHTNSSSAAGALNLTGAISGSGGFTKNGDGLATFGTGAKTYTGATVLNGGRMRISVAAQPSATSSFTINAGAQLTLITAGTYNFGSGNLNLNGIGATTGPFSAFPGAIRNDTGLIATIGNTIVLQSDTLLHVEGLTGSLTLANSISGVGGLTLTALNSSAAQGTLVLNGLNTYQGDTLVRGGNLLLSGANATLGLGDVFVDNTGSLSSIARLTLASGVLDGISDLATLWLAGGGVLGTADQGFMDIGAGDNEIVSGLFLGGIGQAPGTYGSTASGAMFQSDEYFTGLGMLTVIPEPSTATILLLGFALGARRIWRRK